MPRLHDATDMQSWWLIAQMCEPVFSGYDGRMRAVALALALVAVSPQAIVFAEQSALWRWHV